MEKNSLEHDELEIISFMNRHINLLNEENIITRKNAIIQIYQKISEEKLNLLGVVSQQLMINFNKSILKCFSDQSEKIRSTAIKILKELISRCEDMAPFLPYILSILSERVNCHDLEGILSLPEVMRPPPSQKPQVLIKLIEHSEEIRLELCDLISIIISCCTEETIIKHLDDMCNILRALAMDPFYEVQKVSCRNISEFARSFKTILLHFSEILARSLLLPLVSKKSKVKIAAIEALGQVFQCGVYKYNVNIMEILIGFRDPNSVAIKEFYEPSHKINYFAFLINDPKTSVRDMFIRSIGDWVINLEDRFDHYSRLVPYLLSGLFDSSEEIQTVSYEVIEECGAMLEKEREKEFRDQRQYGVDSEWTMGGALINLPLPHPFVKRPRFGSRIFIRSHVRKFFHALYKELKDWKTENREKAANLIMLSIVYSEDYMTQFLYQCLPALLELTIPKEKENIPVADKICTALKLLGRFCDFKSYFPIIKSNLLGEYSENQDYFRCALKSLECLVSGSLEATIANKGLGNKLELVEDCLNLLNDPQILKSFASLNSQEALQVVELLFFRIKDGATSQEKIKILAHHSEKIMRLSFNLAHITIFDRPMKLLTVIDEKTSEEIIKKFSEFSLFNLLQEITNQCEPKMINFFTEYVSDLSLEKGSLSWDFDNSIKLIISISSNVLLFNLENDISLLVDHLNQMISIMGNPDFCDLFLKISIILLKKLTKLSKTDNQKKELSLLHLGSIFSNLIDWLVFSENKLKENFLKVFFQNSYEFSLNFFKENPEITKVIIESDPNILTKILLSWLTLQKNHFKPKGNEIIGLYSEIFKNFSNFLNTPEKKNRFFYQNKSNPTKKIFFLPVLIDFFLEQFDSITFPNPIMIKNISNVLIELLTCLPTFKNELYKGDDINYPDYDLLVNKLMKSAIDSSDSECKEFFNRMLKLLWEKTPMNFQIYLQAADYHKQHARLELLTKIGMLIV